MKLFFLLLLSFPLSVNLDAQIPKSGTYTYSFCDIEYNQCLYKCKVKIKGKKIWVYAPPNLSGIKEGELFESGTIKKQASGKWTIINLADKIPKSTSNDDLFVWIDFKKKQFWSF